MKTSNFWRSLFFSALAVAAFGACSDDDDTGDFDAVIKVDDKKETTIGVAAAGGETQAVAVTSAGAWTLAFDADQEWCFPNVTSGKGGTTELVFSVDPLPEGVSERSATAVLSSQGRIFEVEYTVTARVTVRQSESGSTIPTTNVASIREKLVAMNLPTDNTKVAVTEELAAMTITGIVVSEASGVNWGNAYNIAVQDESQAKDSGLTLNATKFSTLGLSAGQIVSIPLTGATGSIYYGALQLNIASDAEITVIGSTPDAPEPVVITPAELPDYQSMLVQIDNCYATAGYNAAWNTSTNNGNTVFTTTAGLTFTVRVGNSATFKTDLIPEKSGSMIGLAGINASTSGTVYQVSPRTAADIRLTAEIPAPEYTKATIAELKVGNYEVEATIVAVYQKGLMLADATGYTLVFNNAWQQPTTEPYNPYIGDVGKKATVKGAVSEFNGLMQFTAPEITIGDNSDYTLPTPPLTFDAAALTAYESDKKYEYVSLTGTLVITDSGDYNSYTLLVSGYTAKTVTLAYGLDSYYTDKGLVTGDVVDITGFAIGFDTQKVNIMVREIAKNTTTPALTFTSEVKPFAGSSPVAQTLDFEARNVSALALEMFTFKGDNADKFNVDSQSGNSVTISAKGDNDSGASYTATLVVTVDGTVLAEVDVKQEAQLAVGTKKITMDISSVVAGKSGTVELGSSNYGSQSVTDENTWYTWKMGSFDFAAARLTQGAGKDGTYNYQVMQVQGNATDTSKQGFILNNSSLGNISKIIVTCQNSKAASKPGFKMYFGTAKNPTGNEISTSGAAGVEVSSTLFTFTEEFDVSGKGYGYFKLLNPGAALYVKSIEIIYKD